MAIQRTQEEIVSRIKSISADDFFGVERAGLISALTLTHGQPFLDPSAWADWQAKTEEELRAEAAAYLEFAIDKAHNHRGLSAQRSVGHYRAWVWLLEPRLFDAFDAAPYENYGVPQLKAAALALGFEEGWSLIVDPGSELDFMSQGRPCSPQCDEGCQW
jgi:hypothetical protein